MKYFKKILGITATLFCFAAYANDNTLIPSHVVLDQSQDVLFDTFSSNAFSLQLLQAKNKFNPNDIVFGGSSEFDWQHWQGDKIEEFPVGKTYEQGTGLYWTQASLDLMANLNAWTTVFLSGADSHIGRNDPDANYVYWSHAFIVFGNLDQSPFYATTGINTIPFGVFAGSGSWDQPLTETYFNPAQAPQVSLAYNKNGLSAAATGYNDNTDQETHYAYSVSYNKNIGDFGYGLGAGYLTNLKMSDTNSAFTRPNTIRNFQTVNVGDMGAITDLNANIQYRQISLAGEYDLGSNKINGNDHTPEAYAITTNYTKAIAGKDTVFGMTYSTSLHLKDLPTVLPGYDNLSSTFAGLKNMWAVNVTRPIIKNTWLGLDFERATTNTGLVTKTQAHTYTTTLDLTTYL